MSSLLKREFAAFWPITLAASAFEPTELPVISTIAYGSLLDLPFLSITYGREAMVWIREVSCRNSVFLTPAIILSNHSRWMGRGQMLLKVLGWNQPCWSAISSQCQDCKHTLPCLYQLAPEKSAHHQGGTLSEWTSLLNPIQLRQLSWSSALSTLAGEPRSACSSSSSQMSRLQIYLALPVLI